MARLFVIEAPGKARTFASILRELGEEVVVQATVGHLFGLPDRLEPVGIDRAYRDFARVPLKIDVCERLRREAGLADEVVIATDADQEGDVIAWDVATLVRDMHPSPLRMRLRGMDKESVREALGSLGPVLKRDAVAGRTRAIVDRLIGAAFTKDGVPVGRISTAMLGMVAAQKPGTSTLRLVAPAKDNGRPYTAECPVEGIVTPALAETLAKFTLPPIGPKSSAPLEERPGHMGDIMVRCGDELDVSPAEAGRRLQRNYEAGTLSYPRAGSRAFSPLVAAKMAEVLRKAGYGAAKAETFPPKPEGDVHDAPYPIGKVDLASDPRRLDEDAGVRAVVARGVARAGVRRTREHGLAQPLWAFLVAKAIPQAVADKVVALDWTRDVGPRVPGQQSYPESAVVQRRADTVLLERSIEAGLGRPSTWGNHVERFMSRGLVDGNLALTAKGRRWHAASPPMLLDPRISAAIEQACERYPGGMLDDPDREPWELNAERIATRLPESIREPMRALTEPEAPRRRVDPISEYGLDRDFVAEAAELGRPAYAPTVD